jgi:O-antigen/teichoic acid export membrane protein
MSAQPRAPRSTLLGRNSAIYGLGSILGMAGSLVLLPFITRALGPAAYGALELFTRTAEIAVVFGLLGMRQAFLRHYFDHDTESGRARASSTTLIFALLVGVVAILAGTVIALAYPSLGAGLGLGASMPMLLGLAVAAQFLFQITTAFLQVRNEAARYVGAQLGVMLLYVAAALYALFVLEAGAVGVAVSHVLASSLMALACAGYLVLKCGFTFDRHIFRDMLRFGLPFIPAVSVGMVMASADRYILVSAVSLEQLGIYSLAMKIATVGMTLVCTPLGKVWGPFVFSASRHEQAPRIIGDAMLAYLLVVAVAGAGIAIVAPVALPIVAPAEFADALLLIPLLCLGQALASAADVADVGILVSKRTWFKPIPRAVGAVVVIAALLLLVPKYGVLGAAVAVAVCQLAHVLTNMAISQHCFPIQLPMRALLGIVAWVGAILVLAVTVLQPLLHPWLACALGCLALLGGLFFQRSRLRVGFSPPPVASRG